MERRDIENGAEADAVSTRRETGFVEQRPGALQVKPVSVQSVAVEGARVVQRAVSRAGQPSMQRVHHELPVDGVGDGLSNPQVVEGRPAQVELDIVDRTERFVAGRAHAEVGIVLDPQNVAKAQAGERVVVHFARLQREHARRRLLEKPDDDPVEQRPSLDEEVVVALEDHMLSPHPFLEPEGAGADGRGVHGMGLRVPAVAEDVFGNDRHQERDQRLHESGMRLVEPDRDGMGVRRVHPAHRVEHGDAERVVFLHDREREGDILGGHRPAVVEAGVRVEMEGVAAAVFGNLPAFGEIGPGFEVAADAH